MLFSHSSLTIGSQSQLECRRVTIFIIQVQARRLRATKNKSRASLSLRNQRTLAAPRNPRQSNSSIERRNKSSRTTFAPCYKTWRCACASARTNNRRYQTRRNDTDQSSMIVMIRWRAMTTMMAPPTWTTLHRVCQIFNKSYFNYVFTPHSISAMSKPAKPKFEVVWCCPLTQSIIRYEPKRAQFSDIQHAIAFVKCFTPRPNCYVMIRVLPVGDTISADENTVKLLSTADRPFPVQWEVLGMLRSNAAQMFKICEGERLVFADKAWADAIANFVNGFSENVRADVNIVVVKYQTDRVFQEGLATQANSPI
jgi:hypothetical protein